MKYEPQTINGKPHFGYFFGTWIYLSYELFTDPRAINFAKDRLYAWQRETFPDLEYRHSQFIERFPQGSIHAPLSIHGTLGIKFMAWGRAFKIMRLLKKGIKRYKKKLVNGRRKWVRLDKKRSHKIYTAL